MLKQTAVYWAVNSDSAAYDKWGDPIPVDPVEVKCRWVDVVEEFIDINGVKLMSHSKVYVDRDVDISGFLFLGTIADLDSAADPQSNDNAWEIMRFDKLPTLKADKFLRTTYL
jgi:hypothetical protein